MSKPDQLRLKRAENLVNARIAAGYKSALAASTAMGKTQSTYSAYERGKFPYDRYAQEFANFFKVSPKELLDGTVKPTSSKQISSRGQTRTKNATTPIHIEDISLITKDTLDIILKSNSNTVFDKNGHKVSCFTIRNPDRTMTKPDGLALLQDDILVFDSSATIRPADFVLARVQGEDAPIFRVFYPSANGGASYEALNPLIDKITVAKGKWENLARLTFVMKPVESLG